MNESLILSSMQAPIQILGAETLKSEDGGMGSKVFRNILIHGYASVDDRLVWGVVERRLESLLDVIAALISED